eukprot:TRINITY_DN168_c0_g1_i1.p1 TRINITY_DN168_c0_g1~~TRINITY_DN168_c0_g1_i1.p1  ORF type:complete len:831 (-),score=270.46 TRINITY_DN168_c0_g1_i1:114-2462(-)
MSGTITVKVKEGRNLIAVDKNGTSDPYVVVSFGSASKKTKAKKKTLIPDWGDSEVFTFSVESYSPSELLFEVFDFSKFIGSHKRMGRAKIEVKEVVECTNETSKYLKLVPTKEKDEVSGELVVSFQFVSNQSESSYSSQGHNSLKSSVDSSKSSLTTSMGGNRGASSQSGKSQQEVSEHPLFTAIRNSDLENVRECLKDSQLDLNMKDKYDYTPLHAACCLFSDKDDEVLSLLLEQKGINVNIRNADNNVPLHYFCAKFRSPNCTDSFEIFIEKGADVNAQNNYGETPLHKAIFNNSVRVLMTRLLIKAGADPNKPNNFGEIPLHWAARLGRNDLVTILLKGGSDVNAKGNKEKKTAYDLALEGKYDKMASILLRAKELFDWLDELQMEKYKTNFINEEMYKELIPDLNEEILDRMSITTTGHRLKLLKAAKALKETQGGSTQPTSDLALTAETTVSIASDDSGKTNATDIEAQLEKLKYINKSGGTGSWILKNDDCEFTIKLGSGTSGTVYKGLFRGEEVAIKVLKTEQSAKELDEFKKEFHIMSTIQSPYIVFFFGAVLEPKLCMVMELCALGSLYHVMNDLKIDFDWTRIFNISREMVKGVDCLHAHDPQILHRDFKSLNIMVNSQLHCKVGDFGLSRFNTDTQKETLAKMRGTFAYCAPEVYRGEKFTTKADVFSIAIVLWELVMRCMKREYQRPYGEYPNLKLDFQIIIQTARKGLRPTMPESTPEKFVQLIKECWDPEPAPRPSCKEILMRLDALEEEYKENTATWKALIDPVKEA